MKRANLHHHSDKGIKVTISGAKIHQYSILKS